MAAAANGDGGAGGAIAVPVGEPRLAAGLCGGVSGFLGLGARAYQADVQIIESAMVQTARWINQNTPPEALIAAHDIGALGYFGGRKILDMAGIISPDVIPLMGDDAGLREWLLRSHAAYLVIAPGWDYPALVQSLVLTQVYSPHAPYSPAAGGENMLVYRLGGSP